MTLSTTEIIKSKKHVFILLSILIFASGVVFGYCVSTFCRFRIFDPMKDLHRARSTFIDNTAALAATPEKEKELKQFVADFMWQLNKERFNKIFDQSIEKDLSILQAEVEKRIPENKDKVFEQYINIYKQDLKRLRPPGPPPLPR